MAITLPLFPLGCKQSVPEVIDGRGTSACPPAYRRSLLFSATNRRRRRCIPDAIIALRVPARSLGTARECEENLCRGHGQIPERQQGLRCRPLPPGKIDVIAKRLRWRRNRPGGHGKVHSAPHADKDQSPDRRDPLSCTGTPPVRKAGNRDGHLGHQVVPEKGVVTSDVSVRVDRGNQDLRRYGARQPVQPVGILRDYLLVAEASSARHSVPPGTRRPLGQLRYCEQDLAVPVALLVQKLSPGVGFHDNSLALVNLSRSRRIPHPKPLRRHPLRGG